MKHMLSDLKIHKRLVGDNLSGEGALANRLSNDYSAYSVCTCNQVNGQRRSKRIGYMSILSTSKI
jgi:hypothetical protein